MIKTKSAVYAYIDGQNLYAGLINSKLHWQLDIFKFYRYLKDKFNIYKAFYYVGVKLPQHKVLYRRIHNAGFIVKFRAHNSKSKSYKKGNVDVDIVYDICTTFYKKSNIKFVLVTQDGDYIRLVNSLVKSNRLVQIIFPNAEKASKLYKHLPTKYWMNLTTPELKAKLGKYKT